MIMMASSPPSFQPSLLMLLLPIISFSAINSVQAFSIIQPVAIASYTSRPTASSNKRCRISHHHHYHYNRILLRATTSDDDNDGEDATIKTTKKKGDSLRDATGIRPSLHPTTINCVAEALLLRSQRVLGQKQNKEGQEIPIIDTLDLQAEPIEIAIASAGIAMSAIDQRKSVAETDETTDAFTMEESQTISGRVVGVVMRIRELEGLLIKKVNDVKWVGKYGEEESFGVLKKECQQQQQLENADDGASDDNEAVEAIEKQLADSIKINPLLRMNRAECLLALFISTVEAPKMEMVGESVPGGSMVDFIDADRLEVLM
mmetsp:Transcript_35067/g.73968  ORF Transcript_35067/g.73968 Transcript_35067/m.73968 type:complete len:318 (+) Transcript_35067:30-983(+)